MFQNVDFLSVLSDITACLNEKFKVRSIKEKDMLSQRN